MRVRSLFSLSVRLRAISESRRGLSSNSVIRSFLNVRNVPSLRPGLGDIVACQAPIDHAGDLLPVACTERMATRHKSSPGVEHLVLCVSRPKLRAYGILGQLK